MTSDSNKYTWGDLITLEYGKPVADKDSVDGNVPVFGTNGQIGTSHLSPLCKIPSFIVGRKGAYRGVHFSNIPFSVIDTAFYALPISDVIDIKWAYYKFLTYDINRMDSGSAIPSTDRYELYRIPVKLPSIEIQKRIVSILDAIVNQIKLNTTINENLEQQARAFFVELFITNANPEWRIGTISDLGNVVGGGTPSKKVEEYYTDNGIAWITPKDLSNDKSKFIARGETDITDLGLSKSSATLMPKGTVLFSSRAPIGYIAIADNQVSTNQGFKSIVPFENIGTAYIYYFLKENLSTIENVASGSTFKEVSGSTMKNFPAVIPDSDTLAEYQRFCNPLFEQQRALECENRYLSTLRDTLLPKLMNGEIDVSEVKI